MVETEDIIAELLLRWEESFECGDDVSAHQLCKAHPELEHELQSKIDSLKKMAWMNDSKIWNDEQTGTLTDEILGGRYRIVELIGRGGYGEVYKSHDSELDRHVAIKVPTAQLDGTTDSLIEEARKVAKLRHPGIVTVHDVGIHDGDYFIVSELIEGSTLAEQIGNGETSTKEAVLLVAEIAENLAAAHKEGFIHRDIKPSNILINSEGKPLITDFGIALTFQNIGDPTSRGTLRYMSPEQVANEPQLVDQRTDIFSIGVVLYELLTGQHPFPARTPGRLREQVLFRPPADIPVSTSKAVQEVCLKCLSKHPADRFESATDLSQALRSSLNAKETKIPWRSLFGAAIFSLVILAFLFGKQFAQNSIRASESGVFIFEGNSRIVTPLERFAPVTIEAWVRPDKFQEDGSHFIIGSDMPGEYGIGLGTAPTNLCVEYIAGKVSKSKQPIPIRKWSHVAAVFGAAETRIYFNGKHCHTGPVTEATGGTNFVIGNVGQNNHLAFFVGKIRCARISKGEVYLADFIPDEQFDSTENAMLIYDGRHTDGDKVIDLSGKGNHGVWEQL